MSQTINIKEEAQKYFAGHYPAASRLELEKQIYDWENKIQDGEKLIEFFLDRLGTVKDKRILDVGFGSGGIAIAFNRAGAIMSGVDVDPELKNIAERNAAANGAGIDFKIYNGSKLPYDDDYFDYVICASVLEHVSQPAELLKEMLRVLKPEGKLFLSLPNKYYPKETHTLAYFVSYLPPDLASWYLKILKRSPLEYDNLHFYSYFDIIKMLEKSLYAYKLHYKNMTGSSPIKKAVMIALKKINIHYTIFLKQLIFIIEKK